MGALLAIADLAGEDWSAKARSTALSLSKVDSSKSINQELLEDIQHLLSKQAQEKIFLSKLTDELNAIDEAPWNTYRRGKPIDPRWLGKKLSEYKIETKSVRIGMDVKKGYELTDFEDAFKRYLLPPDFPVTPVTQLQTIPSTAQNVTEAIAVTDTQTMRSRAQPSPDTETPIWNKACDHVTDVTEILGGVEIFKSSPKLGLSEVEI